MGNWVQAQVNNKTPRPRSSQRKRSPVKELSTITMETDELDSENSGISTTNPVSRSDDDSPMKINQTFYGANSIKKFNLPDISNLKRQTLKDRVIKLIGGGTKSEDSKATLLIEECKKCKFTISLEHWDNLMKVITPEELLECKDIFNGQSMLHLCWTKSHLYLFEPLLQLQPRLVYMIDDEGNSPFHYLCRNTMSTQKNSDANDCELISMLNIMIAHHIDILHKNNKGITGLDILEQRIKENNPYDSMSSVKLLYEYAIKHLPEAHSFDLTRYNILRKSHENVGSTLGSSQDYKNQSKSLSHSHKKPRHRLRGKSERQQVKKQTPARKSRSFFIEKAKTTK